MKKIITVALALAMVLTLSVGAFAMYGEDASGDDVANRLEAGIVAAADTIDIEEISANVPEDFQALWNEVVDAVGADRVMELIREWMADNDIDLDADMPDGTAEALEAAIIGALPIDAEGGLADRIASAMSNDFVSFIAGLYIPVSETVTTTAPPAVATTVPAVPPTGDSNVIAIAAFATVSVAAAAAFVMLKKKEK